MSQKTILDLVEALREAGQREHGIVCDYGEAGICPADGCIPGPCECGADDHNAQVNAAAKALVAEIERPLSTEDAAKELGKAIGHAEFLQFDSDFKDPKKRAMMRQRLDQKRRTL